MMTSESLLSISCPADGLGLTVVQGLRAIEWGLNRQQVDVTESRDDGWRRLLPQAGHSFVEVKASGLYLETDVERRLQELAMSGVDLHCEISLGNDRTVRGTFVISALRYESLVSDEAKVFLTLGSSGPVVIV